MALRGCESLLSTLEYGPAPEATGPAHKCIEAHEGKFGHFINNKWEHPEGRSYYTTCNPASGDRLADTIQGTDEDVDAAVAAARKAYGSWSKKSGKERARFLYSIARHLQKHARLLAVVESLDNGKTVRESRDCDTPLAIRHFYYHAGWARLMDTSLSEYKPLGVIGQIIPWNFPLLMLAWKIAPAIAMGNCVVLKPATFTRLSALLFAEICAEAGLPPGVVNIVTGSGRLGSSLVGHSDVDKVAFTGSTGVGKLLRVNTAGSGKKLSLELGGKSPIIVFETADMDSAVEGVVDAIWFNQGQVCCAGSRLLVQESIQEEFLKRLKRRMDNLRVGEPLDKCFDMGAVVDKSQLATVHEYLDIARAEGASIYQTPCTLPSKGLFFPPTLVYDVETSSRLVSEEIFGPILTMQSFRTPKEAVSLANNTIFGLAGSVWTENVSLAYDIAFQIKAGVIWINMHNNFDAAAGFGGYRESGYGREGGSEGLYEYVKESWKGIVRNTFTEEEKNAPWGDLAQPGPVLGGALSSDIQKAPSIDRTYKMYVGGKQVRPDQPYVKTITGPDGTVCGQVGIANRKDVRNAVEAAHKASPGWGARAAYNRAQILYYVAENLSARTAEFASLIARQTGCSEEEGLKEVELSIDRLFYWAAYADKHGGVVQETPFYGATVAINEPTGVIGIACPDKFPLLGFVSLFAPAVVRANTVVIIPSPVAPVTACELYQVFETSDLPAGVVNILTGERDHIVKVMAEHMDVNALWYFGSKIGCYHVENLSVSNMKRTFCGYGVDRDWTDDRQGAGKEFLYHACQTKNIWCPAGV